MRRLGLVLMSAAVAACGSKQSTSSPAAPTPEAAGADRQTVRVSAAGIGSGQLTIVPSGGPNVLKVAASIDRIWKALPAIYDSLAIPLSVNDARQRVIGNEGFKLRRRLGKIPLSKYLECGRSQMEPNADEYEITLSVITRLAVIDSAQTKVTTTVEASARGLQFAGQGANCSTTGTLEIKLQALLKNALMAD